VAEQDRQPLPDPNPSGTASWDAAPPFDAFAVQRTAGFAEERLTDPTATFARTPGGAAAPTATNGGGGIKADGSEGRTLPQIPGYQCLRVVGRGGMGVVYQARNLALDRVEALKLINPGWIDEDQFRARFAREARALARLDHPNVVPIYGAGSWQGLPYLTMKFVAGKTLYHHLERLRRDPPALVRVLVQVARAVQYLHGNGIVHRDLKPMNVLLTETDTPLVADFGLVRTADENSDLSVTHVPLGTRHYMSPEQTLGGRAAYTPACDIWALGVILYEALCGLRPFAHEATAALYEKIRREPTPRIPADRNVPPGLEAIAHRCTAKAVADRYPTAEAVAADLDGWLAGKDIPFPRPAARPRRRVRWVLAAAALLSTLGFSGAPLRPPREAAAPRPRSVGDRVGAGETVWLVGPHGLPLAPTRPVIPGGVLTVDRNGFCLLNALTYQCVELAADPVAVPFRLDGEVALLTAKPGVGRGGFYVGGQEGLARGERVHAMCHLGVTPLDDVAGADDVLATDAGVYELVLLRGLSRNHCSLALDTHLRFARRHPKGAPPPPVWHPIAVSVRAGGVAGVCHDRPFAAPDVARKLDALRARDGLPADTFPTPLGPGVGVFAIDAEVVFRNVRLSPLRP
jgi:hypothetical protein